MPAFERNKNKIAQSERDNPKSKASRISCRPIPSEHDISALLAAADDALEAVLIGLMAFAGLRPAEAVLLLREDISFAPPNIHVRRGKGGQARNVPIDADLEPYLLHYVEATSGLEGDDYLFPGRSKGTHRTTRWAQHIVERVVDRTDISVVTPNDLRRACVLRMRYHLGLETFEMQEPLGVKGSDFPEILRLGAEGWMTGSRLRQHPATPAFPTRRGPGRPPENTERDAELWRMVTVGRKTFAEAARDYSHLHGIDPHLVRDAVRMAVVRYEHRLIKDAWNRGERDVAAIAAIAGTRINRVHRVLGLT